jgi:mono/diheme cytochrome c family protein
MIRSCAIATLLAIATWAHAGEAPSFAKQIQPLFAKYCSSCHNPKSAKGGLDLSSYKTMLEGSDNGPVLVASKPGESVLVLSLEGKGRSVMPPNSAKLRPGKDEIAKVRAWVNAGAKDDGAAIKVALPDIKPKVKLAGPVRAVTYTSDAKILFAARQHELLALGSDVPMKQLGIEPITALAINHKHRLVARASGLPGTPGVLYIDSLEKWYTPTPTAEKSAVMMGEPVHADVILDLAFSPDGKTLATCSYDTQVKLWDGVTGKLLHTLKEHSDAVYGVAFSPVGKLLATTGADRSVKVWDVQAGKLLYTLSEATDWNYAVAWSPDGKHLAAAGVDKSIRVWPGGPTKKRIEHSVFAHEGPVIRLVYSSDGKTLYSLGEDRVVKAWDADRMVERKTYERLPETALSLAVRPDNKQLAVGRYDGVVQLIDVETGKSTQAASCGMSEANPAGPPVQLASLQKAKKGKKTPKEKPAPQAAKSIAPAEGQRGQPIKVTIEGTGLDQATDLSIPVPGASAKILNKTPQKLEAEIVFPATASAAVPMIDVKAGEQSLGKLAFTVDLFPRTGETEANDSPGHGQPIKLPASIVGKLDKAGDIDFYRFDAAKNQQLGVQALTAAVGSKAEAVLLLSDRYGRVLAESSTGFLGHTFAEPGSYALGIRDREFRGGGAMHYRLHVGPIPVITALFPLGVTRGNATDVRVEGVFLDTKTIKVQAAADAKPGSDIPVTIASKWGQPLGKASIVVGEFPEVHGDSLSQTNGSVVGVIPVPGTANGFLREPGERDVWRFHAKKGQRLLIETNAARIGSGLDSTLDILDLKGEPVPRAVLRCQAKTHVTFRDHNDVQPNIRIEAWDELGVNDYLYVSGDLMRIRALPGHPDADCNFFASASGQRIGFLDTTPTHHSDGEPMYKVSIHPPGSMFPPNGFPVFTVNYRNDDGGPGYGRDSRIIFDPPADGEYLVRVGDARGQGGPSHGYRLTVRQPRPSFNVRFSPTSPTVWRDGAIPLAISADRFDGYEGPIALRFENVPPGFHVPPTVIEAEQVSTAVGLYAERDAKDPANPQPLKLVAEAVIDGHKQVKEATGAAPKVSDDAEIVTFTEQSEITARPGGIVQITVNIERRRGFTGRVPVDVKGLPHGVHVLDIGLNGILITERETRRTIALQVERWVEPSEHPIVVLARHEGKNQEHAAKSVLLKIVAK